ncbi:hypothetical protein [Hymenobacter sp.]|uniref:hypothetical protein n=1 Tax=Hymenobacter sp. TaxID=1898978 RepID=UPI00286BB632|nr:hypothetical protein [Hymenobacter sp.]
MLQKSTLFGYLSSLVFYLLSLTNPLYAQTIVDSISTTNPKFLVRNQKGQLLLVYDENRKAWEVPGLQYAGPISFQELADKAAQEFGIKYTKFSLGGLFTYHYPNRYKTIIRPYFTMVFAGFTNEDAFKKAGHFQWFNFNQIKDTIPYPASVMIVEKLVKKPKTLWAGAFEEYGYTNPITNPSVIKFRIIEPIYKLK